MLIQNPDRNREKPNAFESGSGYSVFDHEKAFPYATPEMVLGLREPWEFSAFRGALEGHIFYKPLKRNPTIEFGPFFENLAELDAKYLAQIENVMPDEWTSEQSVRLELEHIREYLLVAAKNTPKFESATRRALA
jgi:hypothetical protein